MRIAFAWSPASSARVVQRWPSGGTYWRGSVQIGQLAGGAGASAYCVPQAMQMAFGIPVA